MAIRKYADWKSWLAGLWDSAIPAGMTAFLTLVTTNGLDSLGIVPGAAMNWKQAGTQVVVHALIAAARFIQKQPRPKVVEETIETKTITKLETPQPPTP